LGLGNPGIDTDCKMNFPRLIEEELSKRRTKSCTDDHFQRQYNTKNRLFNDSGGQGKNIIHIEGTESVTVDDKNSKYQKTEMIQMKKMLMKVRMPN